MLNRSNIRRQILRFYKAFALISLLIILLQSAVVHRARNIVLPYENISQILSQKQLTDSDYATIFRQTGLGKTAVSELFYSGDTKTILQYQRQFLAPREVKCTEVVSIFTRGDVLVDSEGNPTTAPPFVDLQAGDILLTFSTHTLGWRHGHIALAIDENTVIESAALGTNSAIRSTSAWKICSDYIVMRVIDQSIASGDEVAKFASLHLTDVPYGMLSGVLGDKKYDSENFTAQCAYLIWYAWHNYGVDLDGDGGMLTLPQDFLACDKLEVIQIYGIDPSLFTS